MTPFRRYAAWNCGCNWYRNHARKEAIREVCAEWCGICVIVFVGCAIGGIAGTTLWSVIFVAEFDSPSFVVMFLTRKMLKPFMWSA